MTYSTIFHKANLVSSAFDDNFLFQLFQFCFQLSAFCFPFTVAYMKTYVSFFTCNLRGPLTNTILDEMTVGSLQFSSEALSVFNLFWASV